MSRANGVRERRPTTLISSFESGDFGLSDQQQQFNPGNQTFNGHSNFSFNKMRTSIEPRSHTAPFLVEAAESGLSTPFALQHSPAKTSLEEGQESFPKFQFKEIAVGRVVGSGGFCVVRDIIAFRLDPPLHQSASFSDIHQTMREGMAASCVLSDPTVSSTSSTSSDHSVPTTRSFRYVIKMLRRDLPEEERNKGITDLAIEAKYLKSLSHDFIISLRGTSDVDPLDTSGQFFVILDKLVCTLEQKWKSWRMEVGRSRGFPPFGCCGNKLRLHELWIERLQAAHDIACAIQYLHSLRIIYRDLKPDNVGFDSNGTVKLFDFGLAKTLPLNAETEDQLFLLTGNTGSLRYMSPEVALNLPYDLRADTYSFGILLWQICALSVPYAGYNCRMHADLVVRQGFRPKVDKSWPAGWAQLIRECWSGDLFVRPFFDHIVAVLEEELQSLEDFDSEHLAVKHRKTKSVKVRGKEKVLDIDTRLANLGVAEDAGVRKKNDEYHNDHELVSQVDVRVV